jgi:hypothetical protein
MRAAATAPSGTSLGFVTVMMTTLDVSPYGCIKWGRFGVCSLVRLGGQVAWASGTPAAKTSIAPEVAIGLEPFVDLFLTDAVRLHFHGGGQVNLAVASLQVSGFEAWRTPAGTIWLGMDVAFRATGP